MSPCVPGFGGTMFSGAILPERMTLIWKTPLGVRLICAFLIAPFAPVGSAYLKPIPSTLDQPDDGIGKHCVAASSFRLRLAPFVTGLPFTKSSLCAVSLTSHIAFPAGVSLGFFPSKMFVSALFCRIAGVHGQLFAAWVQGLGAWVGMLPPPLFVGVIAASEKSFRLLLVSLTRVRLIVVPLPAGSVSGGPEVGPPEKAATVFVRPV